MPYGGEQEALGQGVVLYEKTPEGVAVVTLNKPDRMNSWSEEIGRAWFDAYDKATADPDVRVIVVTGSGRAFCAGADMNHLQGLSGSKQGLSAGSGSPSGAEESAAAAARAAEVAAGILNDYRGRPLNYALYVPKPIIAAINGACAGAGLSQAMVCDIRFAAEGAKFAAAFPRRGLIAEFGISWALPRAIGTGNAMDVMLSGRPFLAEEAVKMGLVQKVFPRDRLLPEVIKYATDMAINVPPSSTSIIKQQLLRHPALDPDTALRESNRLMVLSTTRANPNFKEGVASYVEKRRPNFSPLDFNSPLEKLKEELFEQKVENERLKAALQAVRHGASSKL